MKLTIKGRIPSKKNSHCARLVRGRICVFPNSKYQEREDDQIRELSAERIPRLSLEKPLKVCYHFYFPDGRKTDLSNKIESVNDMLVRYGLLADDNHEILTQLEVLSMGIDKTHPRCEVEIVEL